MGYTTRLAHELYDHGTTGVGSERRVCAGGWLRASRGAPRGGAKHEQHAARRAMVKSDL
jgi:hypothetical protein